VKIDVEQLIAAAQRARERAYAPHSKYRVGAAIATRDGQVFAGCNIENASFGLTVCAERVAIFNAVSSGFRHFAAIAVVTEDGAAPCGACRQVLYEFAADLPVYLADASGKYSSERLGALLPRGFASRSLPAAASRASPRLRAVRRKRGGGGGGDSGRGARPR
jgi:cytidine deaminase